jgi:hypothetical protein
MLNAIAMRVQAIPTNSHYNKSDDLLQLFFALPDVNFQHFNLGYLNNIIYIVNKINYLAYLSIHNEIKIVKINTN